MTTVITVRANHGWPVRVKQINTHDGTVLNTTRVPPGATQDFYVHSLTDLDVHEIQPGEPDFNLPA